MALGRCRKVKVLGRDLMCPVMAAQGSRHGHDEIRHGGDGVNYLAEILAFEQWLETHYLPISPQLLWYKLMYLCNRSGWSEWVTVDNLRLMAAVQMGREATLIKARDELIKAGLVEYQKGKKGSPNRYRMISIAGRNAFKSAVKSVAESEVQRVAEPVVEGAVESADIYKHKQKQEGRDNPPRSPVERFGAFWAAYPKRENDRPSAERAYCRVLLEDCHITEDDLVAAAVNYAEAMGILGREGKYIRSAASFLADSFFASFLPGQYVRPEKTEKGHRAAGVKNAFSRFEQNEYDFGSLEDELLAN